VCYNLQVQNLIIFFIFIFGSIIGSFLNVVILRYNTGKSIITGRSACFTCGKQLGWYNMLPIFSFLFQRGKCGSCYSKISWQYPAVELLTAISFVLLYLKLGFTSSLIFYAFIFCILIIIAVYDIRHKIIPDDFVYLLITVAFLRLVYIYINISAEIATSAFLGGALMFSLLGSLWLVSSGMWMGFGDAKLVLALGWFYTICYGLTAFIYSFWLGAVIGVLINIFFRRIKEVPFAPFLIAGFVVVFFYDSNLFSYLGSTACIR
jgi:prepilin signal peptidase PulO-like enzyme (type II secretory pathway)